MGHPKPANAMKILVTGGQGMLGTQLVQAARKDQEIIALSKDQLDVTNRESIRVNLTEHKPDVVIHAAAMTTPMRNHIATPDTSISVNILGTSNVALECLLIDAKLVYVSTDYVYPGNERKLWKETDGVRPVNAYAWSKLGGECSAMLMPNSLIVRCAHMNEPFMHETAFVDAYKTALSIEDTANYILRLIGIDACGVYNVGGSTSESIFDYVSKKQQVYSSYREDVHEPIALDSSMDISNLLRDL